MKQSEPRFEAFLTYFKVPELPVTLLEETLTAFQEMNDPLPAVMVRHFIEDYEDEEDLTEYVPCFRLPDTHDMHAVVFWKGELMKYQYFLATYDGKGNMINNAVIGGLQSDGKSVLRSIATIEEDWSIQIVEGEQSGREDLYKPAKSRAYSMQLLDDGKIVMREDEKSPE